MDTVGGCRANINEPRGAPRPGPYMVEGAPLSPQLVTVFQPHVGGEVVGVMSSAKGIVVDFIVPSGARQQAVFILASVQTLP